LRNQFRRYARPAGRTLARVRIEFTSSKRSSLGIEWELELVDLTSRQLTPASNDILREISEHGDGDHEDRRDAERGERAVAGQEHARHCRHHREPGDEHGAA